MIYQDIKDNSYAFQMANNYTTSLYLVLNVVVDIYECAAFCLWTTKELTGLGIQPVRFTSGFAMPNCKSRLIAEMSCLLIHDII